MENNARWVSSAQEKPKYDNHYCCIYKRQYKVCFYNPYSNKWYEFNHETDVDFWLDDEKWCDSLFNADKRDFDDEPK